MDPYIERLRGSNEAPSQASISHIKTLLIEPSKKLLENETELSRLKELIQVLKRDQEKIQSFIQSYDTILAPIRRIPADVLREIFYHCLPTHRYPTMDTSEAPLLLNYVCKGWRSVALSSPRIWAKIYVPLPINPSKQAMGSVGSQIDCQERVYEGAARARSELIKVWLNRSGQWPLSISVVCSGGHLLPQEDLDKDSNPIKGILKIIVYFAPRCGALEFVVPDYMYRMVAASIPTDVLPNLTTLRLHISTSGPTFPDVPHYSEPKQKGVFDLLSKSTNLRNLFISTHRGPHLRDIPHRVLRQLTHLHIHSGIADTDLGGLFLECPNIVECKLHLTGWKVNGSATPHDEDSGYPKVAIHLPYLRTLFIYDAGSEHITAAVYKVIDAPVLNHIEYIRTDFLGFITLHQQANTTDRKPSIHSLLQVSPLIDKLMLGYSNITPAMLHECFEIARHTRHLILGHRLSSSRVTGGLQATGVLRDPYDLNRLTIKHFSYSESDVLLPCLQILEVNDVADFGDEDLLKMIKSRLDASKHGQVALLKSVKVYFTRHQQRDIEEDILQYANERGIDFKLELDYADKPPNHLDSLSPMYGLSSDGRTPGQQLEDSVPYPRVRGY